MKIPFTNIEVKRAGFNNSITPLKEQKAGVFTYQITPPVIVDADITNYKSTLNRRIAQVQSTAGWNL